MRLILAVLIGFLSANVMAADPAKADAGKRYGVETDLKTYPQSTPKEALASVIKAVENKRIDYVVAHLADPEFIDARVKRDFGGNFDEQVNDTRTKLDEANVKLLQRFLKEGDWAGKDSPVVVLLKDVKDRAVTFGKIGDRWYIRNSDKPD
jgi:hypothetical protein